MHAIELTGLSIDNFVRSERPNPDAPGRARILVRMKAASLNFIDLAVASGNYPATFPVVPVADGAGEVIATGPDVWQVATGDRVLVHPKAHWIAGRGTAHSAEAMRGLSLPGSLMEIAELDAASVVRSPAHLGWTAAATLPIAATTAWNAMEAGDIGPGRTVLLLGTGGVSLFALQLAKARGARVIITSSSDEKLARARALGADEAINYRTTPGWDQAAHDLTGGEGVDLVVETVGGAGFAQSLAAVRQQGCVFTIGFLAGGDTRISLFPIIGKAVRVQGNNTGSVANLQDAAAAIAAHAIEPVVDRVFGLDDLAGAYRHMSSSDCFGKIAIDLDWG